MSFISCASVWRGKQEILQAAKIFVAPLLSAKSDERGELDKDHSANYTRQAYRPQSV